MRGLAPASDTSFKIRRARRLRQTSSVTERLLWRLLRDRRLEGFKFRRQVPLGRFVADFACFHPKLVIETDGPFHDPETDAVRDAWICAQGFRIIRVPNSEVHGRQERVINRILIAARGHKPIGEF